MVKNKNLILSLILFIILSLTVIFVPQITAFDRTVILAVQNCLKNIPLIIPLLPDCILYSAMIAIPITGFGGYFIYKKKYTDLIFISSIPLITFILNCAIKPLIHRPRPPYELQLAVHPHSFSYVSSHSLVTCTLWGMVIYYINKYCNNNKIKIIVTTLSVLWILFVGLSRVWLGVHNPTDVLGAYLLGLTLIFIFIKIGDKL